MEKVLFGDEHWLWQGVTNGRYGRIGLGQEMLSAHRLAFEWFKGPIPAGMEIDHLCRVHLCVKPSHLEAVTHRQNMRRQEGTDTHCKRNHPRIEENIYHNPAGGLMCLACIRERSHARATH